jgi:SAM-dependent methyltransferase
MGTAQVQGELWGAKARDWAEVQEPGWRRVYEHVFGRLGIRPGMRVLDVGCGAGGAMEVARSLGAEVCGVDASPNLVEIARARLPDARVDVGEMENLAFDASAFDVVTGFNSYQFAGDVLQALGEARRVCKPGGRVAVLFWGRKEDCDLLNSLLPAVLSLLPPAPPAVGPAKPALSDRGVAEERMRAAGLAVEFSEEVGCQLTYPDKNMAYRALASAAPFVRAERHAGREALEAAVSGLLERFISADGSIVLNNRMRYVVAARE